MNSQILGTKTHRFLLHRCIPDQNLRTKTRPQNCKNLHVAQMDLKKALSRASQCKNKKWEHKEKITCSSVKIAILLKSAVHQLIKSLRPQPKSVWSFGFQVIFGLYNYSVKIWWQRQTLTDFECVRIVCSVRKAVIKQKFKWLDPENFHQCWVGESEWLSINTRDDPQPKLRPLLVLSAALSDSIWEGTPSKSNLHCHKKKEEALIVLLLMNFS